MLSNNTFWNSTATWWFNFCRKKNTHGVHVQRITKMSRVHTLAEILSKIFVKKRRKIGDLIYDHGLTN